MSPLFRSQAYPTWTRLGSPTAEQVAAKEWRRLLESYEDPGIDDAVDTEMREYVERRKAVLEA